MPLDLAWSESAAVAYAIDGYALAEAAGLGDPFAFADAKRAEAERTGEWRWIGVDPTNTGRAGETHVKIGHGREYQDVPPIRGVYRGDAIAELTAGVEMRRLNGAG